MQEQKYHNYSTEDFLNDPAFIRSVRYGEELEFWEEFEKGAAQNSAYQTAKKELAFIYTAKRIDLPAGFEAGILADIDASIDRQERKKSSVRKLYIAISSAAAILALFGISLWLFNATVTIQTAYGEKKTVTLPDGSQVVLNANSSIDYPMLWTLTKKRSVQLKGEAYFKVVHLNHDPKNISAADRFRVSTAHLRIEVLGTEFNVKDRNQQSKVVLSNGSVQVASVNSGNSFILKPSQMAIETPNERLKVVQTNIASERAWIEGNMFMQKTTVREILQELEDVYGQRVKLSDPKMADVTIDGSVSFKSKESVLFVLSNILQTRMVKEGDTVLMMSK
ncbi:fec operon regulator FecR [compost metagenome]|uniref:FecR family protein n=1 Tax=Pedobacter sp. ok626 TaxID=1761882 RepID=UPI000890E3CE|nr:FecR domain-containing protein [Pedobacter sp. ok626]SDK63025.1 FecR family protein [Pedobacter sp. ok626]